MNSSQSCIRQQKISSFKFLQLSFVTPASYLFYLQKSLVSLILKYFIYQSLLIYSCTFLQHVHRPFPLFKRRKRLLLLLLSIVLVKAFLSNPFCRYLLLSLTRKVQISFLIIISLLTLYEFYLSLRVLLRRDLNFRDRRSSLIGIERYLMLKVRRRTIFHLSCFVHLESFITARLKTSLIVSDQHLIVH